MEIPLDRNSMSVLILFIEVIPQVSQSGKVVQFKRNNLQLLLLAKQHSKLIQH